MNPSSKMPRHCEWIQRLGEIQLALQASPDLLVDRASIERVFQVSHRHASRLLRQFGAAPLGGAMVISSGELATKLDRLGREEGVVFERERRERLEQKLSEARQELRARRVVIAPVPEPPPALCRLPEQIQLGPGELRIRFATPTELLQHLLTLAQAVSDDWVDFEEQVSRS